MCVRVAKDEMSFSPCYYWGNALLEKLRIYNGEKKRQDSARGGEKVTWPRFLFSLQSLSFFLHHRVHLPEGWIHQQ